MGTNEMEMADGFLAPIHARLREAAARDPHPDWHSRAALLDTLERLIRGNAAAIAKAISADFGNRSLHETQLLELFPSFEAIRHARRHLKSWMKPTSVMPTLLMAGPPRRRSLPAARRGGRSSRPGTIR